MARGRDGKWGGVVGRRKRVLLFEAEARMAIVKEEERERKRGVGGEKMTYNLERKIKKKTEPELKSRPFK